MHAKILTQAAKILEISEFFEIFGILPDFWNCYAFLAFSSEAASFGIFQDCWIFYFFFNCKEFSGFLGLL
jgi:hypothetical protein